MDGKTKEALKPFLQYGRILRGQKVRDDSILIQLWDVELTVGDFRKLVEAVGDDP